MKYAVLFDASADAQKLFEFLQMAKINATMVECIEDSYSATALKAWDAMRDYCLLIEKETSERKLRKLKDDYMRANVAFKQAPTPVLASVIKRLSSAVKREIKKAKVQA
jgi:hypothetical protein